MRNMRSYILGFREIDKTMHEMVGGKGTNLGQLSKIEGVRVPDGFCVTTEAYKEIIGSSEEYNLWVNQLTLLKADNRKDISETSAKIRKVIEEIAIPKKIADEINKHIEHLGERNFYAVRSSATDEDLPAASFAGQQDTYLNISGKDTILKYISKCWASLFTERAVFYRLQNACFPDRQEFDHRKMYMSVIIQKMIFPDVSGVMFTVDPVTSNRKVLSVDASFGLGEALVSGRVNADNYKVSYGKVLDKKVSTKKLAIYPLEQGGTKEQEIAQEKQNQQALTDKQVLLLEHMGRKIEQHFGIPQDIEWCLAEDTFYFLQSRPVTTLFPIPERTDNTKENEDQENRVYISVGHQQMMTDPIKPLGLSLWLLTTPAPMHVAGGRLFVNISRQLSSPEGRKALLNAMGQHDPLIQSALSILIERGDFGNTLSDEKKEQSQAIVKNTSLQAQIKNDPAIISDLIKASEKSLKTLKQNIQTKSGSDLFDFILEDIRYLNKSLFDPKSMGIIMAAINASIWINEKMYEWLGERNAADSIAQSVPNNITSEMGMELLDVADAIRHYPEVIEYLQQTKADNFLDELVKFKGGQETRVAINTFLNKYGMRCAGEIDITKDRWSEKSITLVPVILSNIKNLEPGLSKLKFEQGQKEAVKKEKELLDRLKALPEGEQKANKTKQMIDLIRNFSGYREYPKYSTVNRFFIYKQALLKEAEQLVQARIIQQKQDVYYLTFEEFRELVQTHKLNYEVIRKRKEDYTIYDTLSPPRVITSDGEIIRGEYKRENLPPASIAGLAVSSGVIEGRARVLLNIEDADLEDGDILVTSFTDPSWTPLFLSIKGLVTEVGGLMTHGAVIAREYGLPAVVGVENATKLIKEGQRIRVNGIEGWVEILS
jgi:rifampicin phosphotransferase